jgi:hypothetical protein
LEGWPEGYDPIDWYTFTKLHEHPKLSFVELLDDKENDPENWDVRKQIASRKKQRTLEHQSKRKKARDDKLEKLEATNTQQTS